MKALVFDSFRRGPLGLALLTLLLSTVAAAEQYEIEIDIETEEDLYELQTQGQISEETLETLLDLLRMGVNLDRAGREELYQLPGLTYAQVDAILEYRRVAGPILDPSSLVDAGVLSADELHRLAPFLVLSERRSAVPISGKLELHGRYTADDYFAPPFLMRTSLRFPHNLQLGVVALTTRQRLGSGLRYDADGEHLLVEPATYGPQVPKFYLRWQTPQRQVVAGSFRLGFGERLTLDNTSRTTPDGAYADDRVNLTASKLSTLCRYSNAGGGDRVCDDEGLRNRYGTRDYGWPEGFRGVSGSLQDLSLSSRAKLALHAFGSYQSRSVYQYQLYNPDRCDDPRLPGTACKSPQVWEADSARQVAYMTLPGAYDEVAGGANATMSLDERVRLGLTGYYAAPYWRVEGGRVDFQASSRYPYGGPFGAVGLFGSTAAGPFRFYGEGARSFDSTPGGPGGGFGLVQRSVYSKERRELTLSFRYYDSGFANPYARPTAAADQFEGLRARDETGVRLRYLDRPTEDWRVRAQADAWTAPRLLGSSTQLEFTGRADFLGFPKARLSGWGRLRRASDCLLEGSEESEEGGGDGEELTVTCGAVSRLAGRGELSPFGRKLTLAVQYQHQLVGSTAASRQDSSALGEVVFRPTQQVRLKFRTRYLFQDIFDDTSKERSSSSYLEAGWQPSRLFSARARYELYAWLDGRASTALRSPNPEHRLSLRLESRF